MNILPLSHYNLPLHHHNLYPSQEKTFGNIEGMIKICGEVFILLGHSANYALCIV